VAKDDSNPLFNAPHLGISYAILLGGSLFLGVEADEKFGTDPVLTLLGGAFGAVTGFYFLYREVYIKRVGDGGGSAGSGSKTVEGGPDEDQPSNTER
jgi:hypothetical protein